LSIIDQGNGRMSVSMRGLSSGGGYANFTNPTVGITIDDVPIGATNTANIVGASFVPQLDPADLQRIEFLKGPQGTLYGATSLAGVMKYVTTTPELTATNGHIDVDGSFIPGGGTRSIDRPIPLRSQTIRLSHMHVYLAAEVAERLPYKALIEELRKTFWHGALTRSFGTRGSGD
jgi:outer membrane receptor protein involved in Fe transport